MIRNVITSKIFCIDIQFLRWLAKYLKYNNPNSVDIHITNQNFERKITARSNKKEGALSLISNI